MLVDDLRVTLKLCADMDPRFYAEATRVFGELLDVSTHYALDDAVTRAAANVIVTRPSNILAHLEFARRPHAVTSFEFASGPRTAALVAGGITPQGLHPSRVGVLITPHPDYPDSALCGRGHIFWRHRDMTEVCVCYSDLLWDFRPEHVDDRTPMEFARQVEWTVNRPNPGVSVGWLYRGQPEELAAHTDIIGRFKCGPGLFHTPWLQHYLPIDEEAGRIYEASFQDCMSEALQIIATLLLFNVSGAIQHEEVDVTRLNRARVRGGKPRLSSYRQTTFRVTRAKARVYRAGGLTPQQGVVLQQVRGHFRSRWSTSQGKRLVFWVDEFTRGDIAVGIGPSVNKARRVVL